MLNWQLRKLKSSKAYKRKAAAHEIGAHARFEARVRSALRDATRRKCVDALIVALSDDCGAVRQAAAEALGTIGDDSAAEPLVRMLCKEDGHEFLAAEKALKSIARSSLKPLIDRLTDSKHGVRRLAEILKSIDPDWGESDCARSATPKFVERLVSEDRGSAEALGYIRDERAVHALRLALGRGAWAFQRQAAESLRRSKWVPSDAERPLYFLLTQDWQSLALDSVPDAMLTAWMAADDSFVVMASTLALVKRGKLDSAIVEERLYDGRTKFVADSMVDALATINNPPAVTALVLATAHSGDRSYPTAAERAMDALERIDRNWANSDAAQAAVPSLTRTVFAHALDVCGGTHGAEELALLVSTTFGTAKDVDRRRGYHAAVRALARICSREAILALIVAASFEDERPAAPLRIRSSIDGLDASIVALDGLGKIDGWAETEDARSAVPFLIARLTSPMKHGYPVLLLGDLKDRRAVESLVKLLDRKEGWRGLNPSYDIIPRALGEIGDATAVEPLIRVLAGDAWISSRIQCHDDGIVVSSGTRAKEAAATALGKIGDSRAVDGLLAAMGDKALRQSVVAALGGIRDPRCVDALIAIVQELRESVHEESIHHRDHYDEAVVALGLQADAKGLDCLTEVLNVLDVMRRKPDVDRQNNARIRFTDPFDVAQSIVRIHAATDRCHDRCQFLIELLTNDNWALRAASAESVGHLGDPVAAGPLLELMFRTTPKRHPSPYLSAEDGVGAWHILKAVEALAPLTALSAPGVELTIAAAGIDVIRFWTDEGWHYTGELDYDDSDKAIEALCASREAISGNILHLVMTKQDVEVEVLHRLPLVRADFSRQRAMARAELQRRGNPPYRLELYVRTAAET